MNYLRFEFEDGKICEYEGQVTLPEEEGGIQFMDYVEKMGGEYGRFLSSRAVLGMGERKKGTINSQWKEDEGDLQENRLPF